MNREFCLGMTIGLSVLSLSSPVAAQVSSDGTLPVPTLVPNSINGRDFLINNGTRSGNNLFHSFSQFSIPTNGSATFNNATNIQNIFGRITGSQVSTIDGILKTRGSANLFLMNPNGIIFGPNAQLQLGGSFLGTTATGIKFEDGIEFSTANATLALLSVKVPIGLQMGSNPSPIVNRAQGGNGYQGYPIGLRVPNQKTLALLGGDIRLDRGNLRATEGHIELGSVASNSYIGLNLGENRWSFDYGLATGFQDITVQRAMVDVSGNGAGGIYARGRNILIQEGGRLMARNLPGTTKTARENIELRGSQSIVLQGGFLFPGSTCTAAFCDSLVSTLTQGKGDAGAIEMSAPKILIADGGQVGFGVRGTGASGAGGTLLLQGDNIDIIGMSNSPSFPVSSGVFGSVSSGTGRGGNVIVNAGRLRVLNGGFLSVSARLSFGSIVPGESTTSSGTAGNIELNVTDSIEIAGVGIQPAGGILTSTIEASAVSDGRGQGGNIQINTGQLSVTGGARISTSITAAQSNGDSGQINIRAKDITIAGGFGSERRSEITATSSGKVSAGAIVITGKTLTLKDSGRISVSSAGLGNAGNIKIDAKNVLLQNQGLLNANTVLGGEGNIEINSDTLFLRSGSRITTNAGSNVNGGNITINSPIILGLENSDISAIARKGRGGSIKISTQGLYGLQYRDRLTPENDVTASSEFGINGNVQINTIGINPANALNTLPIDIVDSSNQITDRCDAAKTSSFVATGRGGMPQNPMKNRRSTRPWNDLRANSLQASTLVNPTTENHSQPIVEASTFHIDKTGSISLITPQIPENSSIATCGIATSSGHNRP